jgi:hypothetical protein
MSINNPGNVKDTPGGWEGQTGKDALKHAIFSSKAYGFRAMIINLAATWRKRAPTKRTLLEVCKVWAPVNDPNANNNPAAYADYVSKRVGWPADKTIPLFEADGITPASLDLLIMTLNAMTRLEKGPNWRHRQSDVIEGLLLYYRDRVEAKS